MITQLLDTPAVSLLERVLNFTESRHQVILENLANVSTPGYVQQDVSVAEFQQSLADAIDKRRQAYNAPLDPQSTDTVTFDPCSSSVTLQPRPLIASPVFHDRGVRSMETLMTDFADNATAHNMAAQFLRNKYDILSRAISMRVQ